jgi:hypothetical protein
MCVAVRTDSVGTITGTKQNGAKKLFGGSVREWEEQQYKTIQRLIFWLQ